MTDEISHPQTNFWFGFAFGVITAGGISYLLGTAKGRTILKQLLDLSQEFGEDFTPLIKRITQELGINIDDTQSEVKTIPRDPIQEDTILQPNNTIGSVLQKIKILSPPQQDKTNN